MIIRDGTAADVRRCADVWLSTQPDAPSGPVAGQPLTLHELKTGRLVVAEHDGRVVGFGGALTRSGVLYIADLFVEPDQQSRGAGRALVAALCAGHHGHRFTFASADRRAQRLYEQFGMVPIEPYHYLDAPASRATPWSTDVELVTAERWQVIAIDGDITRRDRSVDIDFATANGSAWYVAERQGSVVGVTALAPTWWSPWHPHGVRIGPIMCQAVDDLAGIVSAAISQALATHGVDVLSVYVPDSSGVLAQLLRSGFEIIDTDLLMASEALLIDPSRYLPTVDTP